MKYFMIYTTILNYLILPICLFISGNKIISISETNIILFLILEIGASIFPVSLIILLIWKLAIKTKRLNIGKFFMINIFGFLAILFVLGGVIATAYS